MSRHQTRATNSVSLFPFLAVLVCAMGALIFLLLVTTRRIRSESIARAQQSLPAESSIEAEAAGASPIDARPDPAPVDPDAELREAITRLSAERDRKQAELEKRQMLLASAKRRLSESHSALDDLERRARQAELQRKFHDESKQAVQQQTEELESRIEVVRQKVREAQQTDASGPSKYALIPYDGRTGTARRPILIECSERGIRFIPEDVLLTEEDLVGFTESYNPLLVGSRTLIDYWSSPARRAEGPEPYVLLVVRPSGSLAYYAARKLLERLRQPCGYELLQEDWELELPEADPAAKAALQETIRRLLREREEVIAAAKGNTAMGRQLGVRRGSGGFYREDLNAIPAGRRGDGLGRTAELPNDAQSSVGGTVGGEGSASRPNNRFGGDASRGSHSPAEDSTPRGGQAHPAPETPQDERASESLHAGPQPKTSGPPETAGVTGEPSRPGERDRQHNSGMARVNSGSAGSAFQPGEREPPFPGFRRLPSGCPDSRSSKERQPLRRWGLSDPAAGIGFEREITVRVEADHLLVGQNVVVRIRDGQEQKDLIEDVIEAIDAHVRSWGQAPDNFYWVPTIRFLVSPGGNQHYERLHGPLSRFGLSSRLDFTLQSSHSTRREGS